MYSKFTDAQKKDIISQYWNGKPVTRICEEYGVSKTTVYSWIRPYEVKENALLVGKNIFIQKDMTNLQNKIGRLKTIVEILSKADCTRDSPLEERLSCFMRLKEEYGTNVLLEALNISKGTYSKRILRNDAPSYYSNRYKEISTAVQSVFDESKQCYGADKICCILQERGYNTSKKYVLRIMQDLGLRSIRCYSKHDYIARKKKNIVKRDFNPKAPNQVWAGDISQFMIKGVYNYVCVILDLFSRKVIAYKISTCSSAKLVTSVFKSAYISRGQPKSLVFHSDQGTQYTSSAFTKLLESCYTVHSFSFPGRPIDNAVSESFFSSMKREELYRHDYRSQNEFRKAVSDYIENYNAVRPHRYNNYKAPNIKEQEYLSRISE